MRIKSRAKHAIVEPEEPSKPPSSSSEEPNISDKESTEESNQEVEETSSPTQEKGESESLKEPGITAVESTNAEEEEEESESSEEEKDTEETEETEEVEPVLQPEVQHEVGQATAEVYSDESTDEEDVVVVTESKGKKSSSTTSKKTEQVKPPAKTRAQKKAIEETRKEGIQTSVKPHKKRKVEEATGSKGPTAKKHKEASDSKATKQTSEPPIAMFKKKKKSEMATSSKISHGYDLSKTLRNVFVDSSAELKWDTLSAREFHSEANIDIDGHVKFGIYDLLENQGLIGSVTSAKSFNEQTVREFYANLVKEVGEKASPKYQHVFVKGKFFKWSSELINEVLDYKGVTDAKNSAENMDLVVQELTRNLRLKWKGTNFDSAVLTSKYYLLYKIAGHNWVPSKNINRVYKEAATVMYKVGKGIDFNPGEEIFTRVLREAEKPGSHHSLPFPSTIYQVLLRQDQSLFKDLPLTAPSDILRISKKSFGGRHYNDTGVSFGGESSINAPVAVSVPDLLMRVRAKLEEAKEAKARVDADVELYQSLYDHLHASLPSGSPPAPDA